MKQQISDIVDDLLNHKLTRDGAVKNLKTLFSTENVDVQQKEALNAAVTAIYFNDNSDYLRALYKVVRNLTDINDLFSDDTQINDLFKKLNPND